jgi:excinuclease ABC subunit B
MEILRDLRLGVFDVLVGINLLREGLDLPEVSLVAVLDADKEGFLRSETSLIQTMGRTARNANGRVIMYADRVTNSMKRAIAETERRRRIQLDYNREHGIVPETIIKSREQVLLTTSVADSKTAEAAVDSGIDLAGEMERGELLKLLKTEMEKAARDLDYERAAVLRDQYLEIKAELETGKVTHQKSKKGGTGGSA